MSAKPVYFPEEVMVIIKSYLMLPREEYEARLGWWNHHAKIPYINLLGRVFDNLKYEQTFDGTPIPALPDTHSKALKKLYSITDKIADRFFEDIWFLLPGISCCNPNMYCYEEDDLVVKLMIYRNHERMGVDRLQEQLICKKCVDMGEHLTDCGRCDQYYEPASLTYVKYDEGEYKYEYNNYYFCADCVGRVGCEDLDCEDSDCEN